jgi:hypothetical protein
VDWQRNDCLGWALFHRYGYGREILRAIVRPTARPTPSVTATVDANGYSEGYVKPHADAKTRTDAKATSLTFDATVDNSFR